MSLLKGIKKMYAYMGDSYYRKHFDLDDDERVVSGGVGYFDPAVGLAQEIFAATASVASGELIRPIGEQFTYIITNKGSLILRMFGGSPDSGLIDFDSNDRPQIKDTGAFGDRAMIGPKGSLERTKVLVVNPPGGDPFRLILPETFAQELLNWAAGRDKEGGPYDRQNNCKSHHRH